MAVKLGFIVGSTLLFAVGLVAASNTISKGRLPGPHTEIGELVGRQSGVVHYCGPIGYVDLGAERDGPAYYFRKSDGRVIGRCGGHCEGEAKHCVKECPPAEWKCR